MSEEIVKALKDCGVSALDTVAILLLIQSREKVAFEAGWDAGEAPHHRTQAMPILNAWEEYKRRNDKT